MHALSDLVDRKELILFIGLQRHETVLELIALLALQGPVQVVVGGNRFRAFTLARILRRHTVHLEEALGRIHLARPFTCYQTVALFAETAAAPQPLVVIDLLKTFCDENVPVTESMRLLRLVLQHIDRLCRQMPVIVTAEPPPQPERSGLLELVRQRADRLFTQEMPVQTVPKRLL
jgi:hypothetical protein